MAESRRDGPGAAQLDLEQILSEAQHRWLRPAEICEILQNYKKFRIASVPANKPPGGSLFLFDRKVLRYFRKDGHNWRKKRDGKTVREAHEKLKAGSIDVLHCYYAHGEENENFQRRSYWMLEEDLSNIVLVHYREVKGNNTNFDRMNGTEEIIPISGETEETVFSSEVDSSVSSKFQPDNHQVNSQTTDTTSLNSGQASEYEDAESAYYRQASPSLYSSLELQPFGMQKIDGHSVPYHPVHVSNDFQVKLLASTQRVFVSQSQGEKDVSCTTTGLTHESLKHLNPPCDGLLENSTAGVESVTFQPSLYSTQSQFGSMSSIPGQGNELLGQVLINSFAKKQELMGSPHDQEEWQKTTEDDSTCMSKWPVDQKLNPDLAYGPKEIANSVNLLNSLEPCHKYPTIQNKHPVENDLQIQPSNVEGGSSTKSELEGNVIRETANYSSLRHPLLDGFQRECLKKLDSFDRWMSKELGDVSDLDIHASCETYWETVGSEQVAGDSGIAPQMHLDTYMLPPSLSQDQLFSIIDFSPNWASAGSEIKVLITGRFLKSQEDVERCNWSCMFGELEVPAEVVADGVLRCQTPLHQVGRVPFYISCSNRLACSEVREFEYRANNIQDGDVAYINIGSTSEIVLRFGRLLSLGSVGSSYSVSSSVFENFHLSNQITSFINEDENEWYQMLKLASEDGSCLEEIQEQLLQKLLKENLLAWLHQKTAEGGKGPSVLDEDGQGVLHFAAALGYNWAIRPTIDAGVSVNFRDTNGWTALHWAASCGRLHTVALLVSLGAAPGALTDPTPIYPSGRTPADLASSNGHKGIAGYLAEFALSCHLSSLKLKDTEGNAGEISGVNFVQTALKPVATSISDGEITPGQSLKDSLAAVCNATQAAAKIHEIFRVQSFQKKLLKECEDDKFGISDERALSLVVVKQNRLGQHDEPVCAAAIRIQNKFRSWKGRKEYLTIRQQVVKIQAHVRGHQVRKNYKTITWSVGILEKVILRWRRKGSGLRGFKSEALTVGSMHDTSSREDDPDFLKESRKQKEEGLQKALARVKSMVQYPEARDQYRRLLHVVAQIQETKDVYSRATINSEGTAGFDDLIDLEELLDVDTIMSTAL